MPLAFPSNVPLPENAVALLGEGSFNGLVWGSDGVFIDQINGVHDLPGIKTGDYERHNQHGAIGGIDYLSGRTFSIGFRLIASTVSNYQNLLNTVMAALMISEDEKPLTLFDNSRVIYCRCRRRAVTVVPPGEKHYVTGQIMAEFFATDPRIYDVDTQTNVIELPAASGISFPITFPFTFGIGTTGGSLNLVNNGDFETFPVFTIRGPIEIPSIENQTQGKTLKFDISLGSSDYLTVDCSSHAILINGDGSEAAPGVSRRNTLHMGSQWFGLQPGANTIRFHAVSPSTSAAMTITYQHAWV